MLHLRGAGYITEKGQLSEHVPVGKQHKQTPHPDCEAAITWLQTADGWQSAMFVWQTWKPFHRPDGVVQGVVQVMERFVGALSLTLLLTGLAAVAQVQPPRDAATQVVEAGLMTPSVDGDFQPEVVLSRAELASILVRTFRLDQRYPPQAVVQLQDVPPSHWAYQDIQIVLHDGIMEGYRAGRFYPDQRVTRAEAFSIFAQAYGVYQFPEPAVNRILADYPDAGHIPSWAKKSMATALYEGFVNVRPDHRIDPLSPMTHGDMAYALAKHLQRQRTPAWLPWQAENLLRG